MIKVKDLVPNYYYNESRDFQLFGRVYEVVYNFIKTNIDLVPIVQDSKLLSLVIRTLGFTPMREYPENLIYNLCQEYSNIIKNKGSIKGVELAVKTVLRNDYLSNKNYTIYIQDKHTPAEDGDGELFIIIYNDILDTEYLLLTEIFDYILPINLNYNIIQGQSKLSKTEISHSFHTASANVFSNDNTLSDNEYSISQVAESGNLKIQTITGQDTPSDTEVGNMGLTFIADGRDNSQQNNG